MTHRFKKHYSVAEARALIPQIRGWLDEINRLRRSLEDLDQRSGATLARGDDLGGSAVNNWIKHLCQLRRLLLHFQRGEIQIKDLERGLIDFPALRGGREIFLCWERDEDDIEYWHELDTGYAGREKLDQ